MINQSSRYSGFAIALHWLMSILIIGLLGLGFYLSNYLSNTIVTPSKLKLINWHKMLGLTVLMLFVIRITWRTIKRPPALPQNMSSTNKLLAHIVHGGLYLLMLAIPISGILYSQASRFNVNWFGLFELPRIIQPNDELALIFKEAHEILNFTLIALLLAHIGAVIKHQLIDKDNILQRMLFSRKK